MCLFRTTKKRQVFRYLDRNKKRKMEKKGARFYRDFASIMLQDFYNRRTPCSMNINPNPAGFYLIPISVVQQSGGAQKPPHGVQRMCPMHTTRFITVCIYL